MIYNSIHDITHVNDMCIESYIEHIGGIDVLLDKCTQLVSSVTNDDNSVSKTYMVQYTLPSSTHLHRVNGPAMIMHQDGIITCEQYKQHNCFYRAHNLPTMLMYNNSLLICEQWMVTIDGSSHFYNETGPVMINHMYIGDWVRTFKYYSDNGIMFSSEVLDSYEPGSAEYMMAWFMLGSYRAWC